MRKWFSILLCLSVLFTCLSAGADSFVIAGYDTENSGHDWSNNLFFARMEELTGVQLTFSQYTSAEEYTAWKKTLSPTSALPDALFKANLTAQEIQRLYANGTLIDLAPLLEENAPNLYALLQAHPEWLSAITLPGGAIPALPQLNTLPANNVPWINAKWLRTLRLEMPTTAEELLSALRAFRAEDPNRNGRQDEVPLTFTGMWDLRFLGHAFGILDNDYYVSVGEDGKVFSSLTSDQNRAFLAWLHQLWEEELMDHSGFATGDTTRRITENDATITYGLVFGPSALMMVPSGVLSDYQVLMPLSWQGVRQYRRFLSQVVHGTFAITSACSDPAALLRWVDTLYTEEGLYLAYAGREGDEYTRTSDGSWFWNDDAQTVSSTVLTDVTIGEGAPAPGYVPYEYQLAYDDEPTRLMVQQLAELEAVSVLPCPELYLSEQQQARLDAVWSSLFFWAETEMARFVTGDVPLNDETWASFVARAEELGLPEVLSVMQEALDQRWK